MLAADDNIERLQTTSTVGTTAINLTGNANIQTIVGNNGVNRLEDGAGLGFAGDTLIGLAGNDTYVVRTANTQIVEVAGDGTADTLLAAVSFVLAADDDIENLQTNFTAGVFGINLTGNDLAQTITGNAGANRIDGKGGPDTLTGGAGAEDFVFSTALVNPAPFVPGNFDRIVDCNVADDRIGIDNAVFISLAPTPGKTLNAMPYISNTTGIATSNQHRIIHETDTGFLWYDQDRSGGVFAAKHFATLTPGLTTMSAAEFTVV